MEIKDFLARDNVIVDLRASGKERLLQNLSPRAAKSLSLDPAIVLRALMTREQLGSTGMGGGTAIPHARLAEIGKPFGLLARLRRPIDFSAIDEAKVDLVFLLLLPATDAIGLKALASVARRFKDARHLARLRGASNTAELYGAMMDNASSRDD